MASDEGIPMSRHFLPLTLAAAAVVATTVTATGPASASAPAAAGVLNLWTRPNQTGQVLPLTVPSENDCVVVDEPFYARSAANRSKSTAELYLTDDCKGRPAEVVDPGDRATFTRTHKVASVGFYS